jgi:hypothetical protein
LFVQEVVHVFRKADIESSQLADIEGKKRNIALSEPHAIRAGTLAETFIKADVLAAGAIFGNHFAWHRFMPTCLRWCLSSLDQGGLSLAPKDEKAQLWRQDEISPLHAVWPPKSGRATQNQNGVARELCPEF